MYDEEKVTPYDPHEEKGKQIARMFDNIAPGYDGFNHRLSWNIDKRWRMKAIRQIEPFHPKSILDIATGTGDFAILAARRLHPDHLIGADISEKMMSIARDKVKKNGLDTVISFRKEDCMQLSFATGTFDAVTVAFGVRNFESLDTGLSEICRVLKDGGHLSMLELASPRKFPMKQLFTIYSHTLMPLYGRIISKDLSAYRYLTASIEAFPQGEQMKEILSKAGFSDVKFKRLTQGICTVYLATK